MFNAKLCYAVFRLPRVCSKNRSQSLPTLAKSARPGCRAGGDFDSFRANFVHLRESASGNSKSLFLPKGR
jgi:hypothetical protein